MKQVSCFRTYVPSVLSHAMLAMRGKRGKLIILWTSPKFVSPNNMTSERAVAETHRLPFDRLRPNGGVLKSYDFSVHAELVEA